MKLTRRPSTVGNWLAPPNGKIVAGGKGSGQVTQPVDPGFGSEVDDWDCIYTDP